MLLSWCSPSTWPSYSVLQATDGNLSIRPISEQITTELFFHSSSQVPYSVPLRPMWSQEAAEESWGRAPSRHLHSVVTLPPFLVTILYISDSFIDWEDDYGKSFTRHSQTSILSSQSRIGWARQDGRVVSGGFKWIPQYLPPCVEGSLHIISWYRRVEDLVSDGQGQFTSQLPQDIPLL